MGLLVDDKKLFIHIPKTAGTLMVTNFKRNSKDVKWEGKHAPLDYCLKRLQREKGFITPNLKVYSCVRNPWSKTLSIWRYFKTINYMEYYSGNADIDNDFNKWVKWVYTDSDRTKMDRTDTFNQFKYMFNNQLNWFKNEDGGMYKVDLILKAEDINKKIDDIAAYFGWSVFFRGVVNNTIDGKGKVELSDYYNQESIDLVAEHFAEDVERFEYDVENGN